TGPAFHKDGCLVTHVEDSPAYTARLSARNIWTAAAKALAGSPSLILNYPDAAPYLVETIYRAPVLLWSQANGRYRSPPRGWCQELRTFSLAEQYQPRPVDTSYLGIFFDRLHLSTGNRAKVLAFLAGCLIRHSFGPMPALMLRSPYKGTGKSTIAKLAAHLATGSDQVSPLVWSGDAELRKTVAESGGGLLWYDNISIEPLGARQPLLRSPLLNAATQSGSVRARILGESRTATLNRPTFIMTMQGGMIDPDICDRFLYVLLPDPPPVDIIPTEDILPLVSNHWREIRDEIAQLVLQTRPLEGYARPGRSHYRFTDFYRHVAPVVTLAGYDPTALADDAVGEANAVNMELAALLVSEPGTPEDLARRVLADPYHSPVLAAALPQVMAAKIATLKFYLKSLPDTVWGQGYCDRLAVAGGRYSARLETTT
ncbi:MAG: hypothetical protein ACREJF_06290, partial [Candidatus Methylomirabilales bacterium]